MGTCCPREQIILEQSHEQINRSVGVGDQNIHEQSGIYFQGLSQDYNEIILEENQVLSYIGDEEEEHHNGIVQFIQLYISMRNDALSSNHIPDLRDFIRFLQIIQNTEPIQGMTPQQLSKMIVKQANNGEHDCPICLEMIKIAQKYMQLPCRHVFHIECIKDWLQKSIKCPSCRRQCVQTNQNLV